MGAAIVWEYVARHALGFGVQGLQQDQRCLRCSREHLCAQPPLFVAGLFVLYLGKRSCVLRRAMRYFASGSVRSALVAAEMRETRPKTLP
jgi:hypothetical protein